MEKKSTYFCLFKWSVHKIFFRNKILIIWSVFLILEICEVMYHTRNQPCRMPMWWTAQGLCAHFSIKNFHHGVFLECLILYLSKYNLYFQILFRLQKTLKMKKFELLGILVLAYCCDITKNSTFFRKS